MKNQTRVDQNKTSDESIQVFFDGDCPLCRREVAFLSKRDSQGLIVATDIADPSFDASQYDRSHDDFMATIQGRLASGRWISGVEVFRQLYAAVGFKRLVRASRVRPIAWVLGHAYTIFAKHRLRLTGRCSTSACSIPSVAANDNDVRPGGTQGVDDRQASSSASGQSDETRRPGYLAAPSSYPKKFRTRERLHNLPPALSHRSQTKDAGRLN